MGVEKYECLYLPTMPCDTAVIDSDQNCQQNDVKNKLQSRISLLKWSLHTEWLKIMWRNFKFIIEKIWFFSPCKKGHHFFYQEIRYKIHCEEIWINLRIAINETKCFLFCSGTCHKVLDILVSSLTSWRVSSLQRNLNQTAITRWLNKNVLCRGL